jgi:F0F1-type ATP synthase membrane subunit b/b'
LLQERVTEAKHDKEDAKRNMDKAERELDDAKAELARLKATKASDVAIERAQNNVESARSAWQATIEAHKTAMQAETAAYAANLGGAASGAQVVSFAFKPDVLERLKRPLSEWKACEKFDVTGIQRAIGGAQWHDVRVSAR